MKALSLKQPWANWIIDGSKTIETRKWNTKFRGQFLIHASKSIDKFIVRKLEHAGLINTEPTGHLIGIATIVDVKTYYNLERFEKDFFSHNVPRWYPSQYPIYGFVLENVKVIKPIPFKGMLNFFETHIEEEELEILSTSSFP